MLLIDARCADVIRLRSRPAVQLVNAELSVVRHGVLYGLKYVESASFTMVASYGLAREIHKGEPETAKPVFFALACALIWSRIRRQP